MPAPDAKPSVIKVAADRVVAVLNRADELGGEVRDFIQERLVVDPRYVAARKRLAKLLGHDYVSASEERAKADAGERARAKAAPVASATPAGPKGLGDAGIKAQIYGKQSCAWTGRAITILEKHKVDFDFVDLDQPEYEQMADKIIAETHQSTTPWIYLRGQFVGGYNALAEIERLGQLEFALMTAAERAALPEHERKIEIVARPDKDEVAPAENMEARPPVE